MATTPLDILDESSLDGIAALCSRALERPPSRDELRDCLFAPDQPTVVRGDPDVGVVVSVPDDRFIRLLVVDPRQHRLGHGSRLLRAAEADLGPGKVTVGADGPYYLFAGVETTQLGMLVLLERHHYGRTDANFNMDVDLSGIPDDPGGPVIAAEADRDEVDRFMQEQWPNWRAEVLRALGKGTLLIDRDAKGISGFCAWDVNRACLLGPVAVRLDLMGKGTGGPLLIGALHRMRAAGWDRIEVSWVGPIVPYARVGGTIGRVFFVYSRTIT
jgi:GNAT superfamily N-acetyltransferase